MGLASLVTDLPIGTEMLLLLATGLLIYVQWIRKEGADDENDDIVDQVNAIQTERRKSLHIGAVPEEIPGMQPSDPEHGNLFDIGAAGGYYAFLKKLHAQFGDTASFWFGTQRYVSISKPELFRKTAKAFDRPPEIWGIFSPMMDPKSLAFVNGKEGKRRRTAYDRAFSHASMEQYFNGLRDVACEFAGEWRTLETKERIKVQTYSYKVAMKGVLRECFGDYYKDEEEIVAVKDNFHWCWHELETRAGGNMPEPGSPREVEFNMRRDKVFESVRKMVDHRRQNPPSNGERLLIDIALEMGDDTISVTDSINFVLGGYMSTADLMTWCLYFLSTRPEIQQKVYDEIMDVVGKDGEVTFQNWGQLTYLRQFLDESLRISLLGTFLIRRMDTDINLGKHLIPAMTPIVSVIGLVHMDEEIWPEPEKFDPERFTEENSAGRHHYSFIPFGFSGGRKCPGFRFAYVKLTLVLVELLRNFRVQYSSGQGVPEKFHGLLTFLKDDILIDLEERC